MVIKKSPETENSGESHSSRSVRVHLRQLRRNVRILVTAFAVAIVAILLDIWWVQVVRWTREPIEFLLAHPIALVGILLSLSYIIVGLRWPAVLWSFRPARLISWMKKFPKSSTGVLAPLVLIGIWWIANYRLDIVMPFSVGHGHLGEEEELNGERMAAEFSAVFSRRGASDLAELRFWSWRHIEDPKINIGSVYLLAGSDVDQWKRHCEKLLEGTASFRFLHSVWIRDDEVVPPGEDSGGGGWSFNLGPVTIPTAMVTQFLYRVLPTRSRRFQGQVFESEGELAISVREMGSSKRWSVRGAVDARTELMDLLAWRIGVDTANESRPITDLAVANESRPITDLAVAFALGVRSFRAGHFRSAIRFFSIGSQLERHNYVVAMMGAVSRYQFHRQEGGKLPQGELLQAARRMEYAMDDLLEWEGIGLRPVLACLYERAGAPGTDVKAQFESFREFVGKLDAPSLEARIVALDGLAANGSGRHLRVDEGKVTAVDGAGYIVHALGHPKDETRVATVTRARQLAVIDDSTLLYLSADGSLRRVAKSDTSGVETTTLIEGREVRGIKQFAVRQAPSGAHDVFFIDRPGRVYRCRLSAKASSCGLTPLMFDQIQIVRQIVVKEDELYLLAANGYVWRTKLDSDGRPSEPHVLSERVSIKEFFVSADGLYVLHDSGNIWGGRLPSNLNVKVNLRFIDAGTRTRQIFATAGVLYILKNSGDLWRATDPLDKLKFQRVFDATPDDGFKEMFMTPCPDYGVVGIGEPSSCLTKVYLLRGNGEVYQGMDFGADPLEDLTLIRPARKYGATG